MNANHPLRSVLWKEYRQQRAFWLAMGALSVFLQILFVWGFAGFYWNGDSLSTFVFYLSVLSAEGLTALYAIGCMATLFSAEHENGTFEFQKQLPVSAGRLAWGKTLFAIVGTACMLAFLVASVLVLTLIVLNWRPEPIGWPFEGFWHQAVDIFGLVIFEALAWGLFWGLLMKNPLPAVILALICTTLSVHVTSLGAQRFDWHHYTQAVPYRLLILAAVSFADAWLAVRWFKEAGVLGQSALGQDDISDTIEETSTALPAYGRFSRQNVLSRLLWQQFRQNGWIALALIAVIVSPVVNSIFPQNPFMRGVINPVLPLLLLPIIAICLWSMMFFRADHAQQSFRFLAERGVSPGLIWISRLTMGAVPVVGLVLICCLIVLCAQIEMFYQAIYNNPKIFAHGEFNFHCFEWPIFLELLFLALFAVFSIVQFCSLFFRGAILAAFFSVLFIGLFGLWTALMIFWLVPWWWSILPIPLLHLAATWQRMPGWLEERSGLRSKSWLAVAILPCIAIVVAVPFYRIHSVPLVKPDLERYRSELALRSHSSQAQATLRMYEKAWNELAKKMPSKRPAQSQKVQAETEEPKTPPWTPPPNLAGKGWRKWDAAAISKAIQLTIAASKGTPCNIQDNTKWGTMFPQDAVDTLGRWLLIADACQLQADGKAAEAWQRYLAALRVSDSLENNSWNYYALQSSVYQRLPFWAASKNTTPEQIGLAIEELKKRPPGSVVLWNSIVHDYLYNLDLLHGMEHVRVVDSRGTKLEFNIGFWLWRTFLPWERLRAERLLNLQLREQFEILKQFKDYLSRNGCVRDFALKEYTEPSEPAFALHSTVVLPPCSFG
ncbi:MAG: ABC transporter permease, partial [Thermoguttaceae bacterium]